MNEGNQHRLGYKATGDTKLKQSESLKELYAVRRWCRKKDIEVDDIDLTLKLGLEALKHLGSVEELEKVFQIVNSAEDYIKFIGTLK